MRLKLLFTGSGMILMLLVAPGLRADVLEMHTDAITPGERILILDDLLATGGTVLAACKLVERLGGKIVGLAFLVELTSLKGRERLNNYDLYSIVKFEGE